MFLELNCGSADEGYNNMKRIPGLSGLGASRDYTHIILDELAKMLGIGFRVIAKVDYLDREKSGSLAFRIGRQR